MEVEDAFIRQALAEIEAFKKNQSVYSNDTTWPDVEHDSFEAQFDKGQHTRDLVTYYLIGIGGMTVSSLGLVGNMMSLVILNRRVMRSSTYSYLSALSVCDTLFLICTMMLVSKDIHKPERNAQQWMWSEGYYPYMFPYVHALAFTFQVTSIWLTLAFTIDRYIMICHPYTAEPYCTVSRARKVICFLFLGSIIFNMPKFFEYETIELVIPSQNKTRVGLDLTDFGRNVYFKQLYHSGFYIAFVCGLPFIALAVLNSFLMHAVHESRRRGREIAAPVRRRNDTTVMLISVVVVFFICQSPALVSRVIWARDDNQESLKRLDLYILNEIGTFMVVLNSAVNIVPYYFFGKKFRRELLHVFCRCVVQYKSMTRSLSVTGGGGVDSRNVSVCSSLLSKMDRDQLNGNIQIANRKFSQAYDLPAAAAVPAANGNRTSNDNISEEPGGGGGGGGGVVTFQNGGQQFLPPGEASKLAYSDEAL